MREVRGKPIVPKPCPHCGARARRWNPEVERATGQIIWKMDHDTTCIDGRHQYFHWPFMEHEIGLWNRRDKPRKGG